MESFHIEPKKYSASVLLVSGAAAYAFGYLTCHYINKRQNSSSFDIYESNFSDHDEDATTFRHDPDQLELDFKHAEYDTSVILVDNNPYDITKTPNNPNDIVVDNESGPSSIFRSNTDMDWDYETEISHRSTDKPYIIHENEYFGRETEYTQSTLTYYAGDDILVDEKEVPIYNYKSVTGELRFGHGSEDQNVVYVRNDRLSGEYEILRDSGSYEVEVLGNQYESVLREIDLKNNSVLKFRPE